jgi:ribonuclease D
MDLSFTYIQSDSELEKMLCHIGFEKTLFVDTEFHRKNTYYAIFSLLQIGSYDEIFLIDPDQVDLKKLAPLFEDKNIQKVFYSSQQDLEILSYYLQCQIVNYVDIQTMISFFATGNAFGLERAAQTFLNMPIDKGAQESDWSKKPLQESQLRYAAMDIYYIEKLYPVVAAEMANLNILIYYEKYQALQKPYVLEDTVMAAIHKFSLKNGDYSYFYILDHMAQLRERIAITQNVPRQHILPDKVLESLAKSRPETFVTFKTCVYDKRHHNKPLRISTEVMKLIFHDYLDILERFQKQSDVDLKHYQQLRRPPLRNYSHRLIGEAQKLATKTQIPIRFLYPIVEEELRVSTPI